MCVWFRDSRVKCAWNSIHPLLFTTSRQLSASLAALACRLPFVSVRLQNPESYSVPPERRPDIVHVPILAVALRVGSMQMKLLVALTSLLASKRLMKSLKDILLT